MGPDVYAQILGPGAGSWWAARRARPATPTPSPSCPAICGSSCSPASETFGRRYGIFHPLPQTFTVSALGSAGPAYQAAAVRVPQGTLVTAIALEPTQQTLAALLRVEMAVSLAVVVILCSVALLTVRRGLRPLEAMADTAGAIAAGDLTQRVRPPDGRSEIGRFGRALNRMLSQIESAFADKSASEARLRQFVADASHELRTPLTSIRGYTELLRKGAFTDEESRQRALSRVEAEATRMGRLVDDLLLLARLDQGRPLADEPVDLRRLVTDALHDARAVDPERPFQVVAPAPVVVRGDRDRLGQCVHNLVRNAQTHTPAESPVQVEVAAERPGVWSGWSTTARACPTTRRSGPSTVSTGGTSPHGWRHRAGPGHREGHRRSPGWFGRGRSDPGRRGDVHPGRPARPPAVGGPRGGGHRGRRPFGPAHRLTR